LVAGNLFYQAEKILLGNGLSKFIEHINNNVITEVLKTPEQFFKEKTKGVVTEEQLKNLKVVYNKAEKIKSVDIDPNSIHKVEYSIPHSKAHRAARKSEHFSNQA